MSEATQDEVIIDRRGIDRFLRYGAPAMAILWIVGTLVAVLQFPEFDWTANTLAEVGRTGEPTAPILDGSLFLGSVFGILFLWGAWKEKTNPIQRTGLVLMGALIVLVGIGQLGIQQPWLLAIVLSFIFGLPLGFAVYGTGEIVAGNAQLGVISFWFALAHLLAWDIITSLIEFSSAIPTFMSFVLIATWSITVQRSLQE